MQNVSSWKLQTMHGEGTADIRVQG